MMPLIERRPVALALRSAALISSFAATLSRFGRRPHAH
jgi:hypothetical protein